MFRSYRLLGAFAGGVVCSLLLSSCIVGRYVVWNFADVRDHKKFKARTIERGGEAFQFVRPAKGRAPRVLTVQGKEVAFADYLEQNNTVAFLIIQHDTIQYEQYFRGYDEASIVPSFSMAKSVTSMLIGCAIADGLIQSVEEPITNYVPELKGDRGFEAVRIRHLLQMTSGIKFQESYYNPFGGAALYYYGKHLRHKLARMKLRRPPGTQFEYISGGTQMLGLVLERALKGKTISAYFQERIWQPLGMEWDASWSIDQKKNGMEKTFCCINARARDFARLGRLYLHDGSWNGKQIVPKSWVKESTTADTTEGSVPYYKYQWWLPSRNGDFMAQGHLGQFIYVNPAKDLVIVRLGKNEGNINYWQLMTSLAAGY